MLARQPDDRPVAEALTPELADRADAAALRATAQRVEDKGAGSIASASGLREMVADVSKDTSAGPHERIAAAEIGLTAGVILAGAERNDQAFDATKDILNAKQEIVWGMWNQPHFQPEPNAVRAREKERIRLMTGKPPEEAAKGFEQHLGQIATVSAVT